MHLQVTQLCEWLLLCVRVQLLGEGTEIELGTRTWFPAIGID